MIEIGDIFSGDSGEDYEVTGKLGKGGMSNVHKVVRISDGAVFAAKSPENWEKQMQKKRIENEYSILKVLGDRLVENIVRAIDKGELEFNNRKVPILVMEIAQGDDLGNILVKQERSAPSDGSPGNHPNEGGYPVDVVAEILTKIAKSMVQVHLAGYIHRDLKPDNIFVDDIGGENKVTIIDFGIAALKDDVNTFAKTTSIAWTDFYAPPEQEKGTVSIGNDIFSLGATGYQMLLPKQQFKKDYLNKISPPYDPANRLSNSTLESQQLFSVIAKATWPERRDRFANMEDMANMLEGLPLKDNYPRIIAVGSETYPLLANKDEWSLGRDCPPHSEADILIKETSPTANAISRTQAIIKRTGECSFIIVPPPKKKLQNETRYGLPQMDGSIKWNELKENGYPLGPIHQMICFAYAPTPPAGKVDENGDPLQPGPYKVLEYFPPNQDLD